MHVSAASMCGRRGPGRGSGGRDLITSGFFYLDVIVSERPRRGFGRLPGGGVLWGERERGRDASSERLFGFELFCGASQVEAADFWPARRRRAKTVSPKSGVDGDPKKLLAQALPPPLSHAAHPPYT